ncbi:hypothetical protein N7449_005016 [Penicillium cf. viridicatum]|uniref:HSF-type DNA-binding domain-containing protein n=1 Tax=Penicillium cf. viridicatum TaxID=2972119 RepID=A0A9W9SYP8_9EURO|nr:hypothetical protein N7449_005016 [Penicillium cf. viridicatum]
MTTSINGVSGDETCQTIDKIVNNFISQHQDKSLNPLRPANISVSEFSAELLNHLSVLNEGGSIAFGRGEYLTSKSLSQSLETLFSIATPSVREGPPLTWTRLVLFAGPQFEGPAQLKVENSSVELSENDLKLLRSDKDDCKKELQSNDTVLQELVDARKTIGEEQISLVARLLRNHRDLICLLSENKQHANHREEALSFKGAQPSVPKEDFSSPIASPEHKDSGYRDSPYTPTTIQYARNNRSGQPPENNARPGIRLHTSDFIQSLSEILDDPNNGDVIRWSENRQSVYVAPESEFSAHILAKMSTKSHQSLVRRLYYFGFHKTRGVFYHESFSRGQPSSIGPNQEMSHSRSRPTPLRNSASQRGPRYKVIKRKRARESV